MSEFIPGKPSSGIKDQMELPGMDPKKESSQEKAAIPEEKQFYKETIYIPGDSSRDGTTIDTPLSQDKEGNWWLGKENVTPSYALLIAARELPSDVVTKLRKLCNQE